MDHYYGWGLPINISTHGDRIDLLIYVFHVIMAILFVGWLIYFLTALVRFRARPGRPAVYASKHFTAPTYLEVVIALVEAALLVGFSYPIIRSYQNTPPQESEAVQIRIVAEQFAWNIHYPGPDGVFGRTSPAFMSENPVGIDPSDPAGQDDIQAINQLHIPVNQPVIAHLSSKDVIHSFSIPVMRVKQDVIPGQSISVWFEATQTGEFEIACAQLCGLGHYRMKGYFTVETEDEFKTWLREQM